MPKAIRGKSIRDTSPNIVGKTQAAGLWPSTEGIASVRIAHRRTVTEAVRRGMDCAQTLSTLFEARDSADPVLSEIGNRLLENPEFIKAMLVALEKVKSQIKVEAAPKDGGQADPRDTDLWPETPCAANSGADSRRQPGMYSRDMLMRDLATQKAAALQLSRRVGVDAADAAVARAPLVPPWDSPIWSSEARESFRRQAEYDGWAASHMNGKAPAIAVYLGRGE